jgi:hypothetical protein
MDEYASGALMDRGKPKHSEESQCHSQSSLFKVDRIGLYQSNRGAENLAGEKKKFNSEVVPVIRTDRTHWMYEETLLTPQLI